MGSSASVLMQLGTEFNLTTAQRDRYRKFYGDLIAKGVNDNIALRKLQERLELDKEINEQEREMFLNERKEILAEVNGNQSPGNPTSPRNSLTPANAMSPRNSVTSAHAMSPRNSQRPISRQNASGNIRPLSSRQNTSRISNQNSLGSSNVNTPGISRQNTPAMTNRRASAASIQNANSLSAVEGRRGSTPGRVGRRVSESRISPRGIGRRTSFQLPQKVQESTGDAETTNKENEKEETGPFKCSVCPSCIFETKTQLERHEKYSHVHAKALEEKASNKMEEQRIHKIATNVGEQIKRFRQEREETLSWKGTPAQLRWWRAYRMVHRRLDVKRTVQMLVHHNRKRVLDRQHGTSDCVFEGTKFFPKSREHIDVMMYLHDHPEATQYVPGNSPIIEVVAYHTEKELEFPRIYVSLNKMAKSRLVQICIDSGMNDFKLQAGVKKEEGELAIEQKSITRQEVIKAIFARMRIDDKVTSVHLYSPQAVEGTDYGVVDDLDVLKHFCPAVVPEQKRPRGASMTDKLDLMNVLKASQEEAQILSARADEKLEMAKSHIIRASSSMLSLKSSKLRSISVDSQDNVDCSTPLVDCSPKASFASPNDSDTVRVT